MVQAAIPKQAFVDTLRSLSQKLESWTSEFVDGLENSKATAIRVQGDCQDKVVELKERLNTLEDEYSRLQASHGDEQETVEKYEEWIAWVNEKVAILHERVSHYLDAQRTVEDRVSVAMADLSSKLEYRKQKFDALRKATSWYKDLLGIRCEYSNAVKFIFTNIDHENPNQEFSFSIHHDKVANRFSMVECEPNIGKSGPLLDSLNVSNDLSQFVRSMRWEFVAIARGESAQETAS